jgi:hypothetical protein
MGDRYFITVKCECGHVENDVYYAPTCGFTTYKCKCGKVTDLAAYTGISYEDCSNRDAIAKACQKIRKRSGKK